MNGVLDSLHLTLKVTDRPDGGVRVTSDDVPGLLLSGSDRDRIWSVVGPGIERLLRANRGLDVVRVLGPMTPPATCGDVRVDVEHRVLAGRSAA